MANEKYIKVTPKGETEPRVILATLRNFYVSQGAKIEKPTNAEIKAAYPDEDVPVEHLPARDDSERLRAEIAQWKANATKQAQEIHAVRKENEALIKENTSLESEIERLKGEKASLETSLAETEQLVNRLKGEAETAPSARKTRYAK